MKRKVITLDAAACNGCGLCIPNCPEGAIQMIDGKARLISDLFCDGLGACLGTCPQGAITIEEREAAPYDEAAVMANVVKGGPNVINAHLTHLRAHGQTEFHAQAVAYLRAHNLPVPPDAAPAQAGAPGGCPGMRMRDRTKAAPAAAPADPAAAAPASELRQWPIQLHLLNPAAPFFAKAHLLVAADCVPFAFANFHHALLRGKTLIMLCPKLDHNQEEYVAKLAAIFSTQEIQSITIAHMEVPCCFGVRRLVDAAQQQAGTTIPVHDVTITLEGAIRD
jgi:Pyruvate/2-oxoacid:ferredoxin oxidoreductase delta subunit